MKTGPIYLIIILFVILFIFIIAPREHHMEIGFSRISVDTIRINNTGHIDYHSCMIEINNEFEYYRHVDFLSNTTREISLNDFPGFSDFYEINKITLLCDEGMDSWTLPI